MEIFTIVNQKHVDDADVVPREVSNICVIVRVYVGQLAIFFECKENEIMIMSTRQDFIDQFLSILKNQ